MNKTIKEQLDFILSTCKRFSADAAAQSMGSIHTYAFLVSIESNLGKIKKELENELSQLLETEHGKQLVKESIAEVFHESWVDWSKQIAEEENISESRLERWSITWEIPYCQIPIEEKHPEFELAERVMRRLGLID